MARIEVIGLGPAGPDLLTGEARRLLDSVPVRFLRTDRHPAAEALAGATTFDHLYERCPTLEEVYRGAADSLVAAAREHGRVLFAVPGSPSVAERTVALLLERGAAESDLEVVVHPALSFLDLVWARLGVDPVASGVHLVDAHRFEATRPADGGAVLVTQCDSRLVLSDVKLAVDPPPGGPVTLLWHLGLPEERLVELEWHEIDRAIDAGAGEAVEVDHLSALWVPDLPPTAGGLLDRVAELLERLRVEDPWKAAQTHGSLTRYLLEESHEVLEALDDYDPASGEGAEELASELGDLLYQVVFHASLARQAGWFELADVVTAIHDKLDLRHPHLGTGEAPGMAELVAGWESAKVVEHGRASSFDGIPAGLPALLRALKLYRKAEALGLEVPAPASDDPAASLLREAEELMRAGRDPEDALRRLLSAVEGDLRHQEAGLRRR